MRTSGLFTTHTYTIPVESARDDIFLVMFSDVHWGSEIFCHDAWEEFLSWAKAHEGQVWFIGNGDYIEYQRSTIQSYLQHNLEPGERAPMDWAAEKLTGELCSQIRFMGPNLIGLGDGNHGWTFRDGRNETMMLCHDLETSYLGVLAAVRITFDNKGHKGSLTYVQHHGTPSNTTTAAGPFMSLDRMARCYDADIIATGDNHALGIVRGIPRVGFEVNRKTRRLEPKERYQMLVKTGGFTAPLRPGVSSYLVDRNKGPLALGAACLRIKMRETQKGIRIKMAEHGII